jgi:hypothetical protein
VLWIGTGRFDGRIGDGNGPRACRGPDAGIGPSAQADGTVRQLAWGTRVVKLTSTVTSSTVMSIGCCGSGVAASMGESATAMGSGRAVRPMPASSRRPRPTGRSGSWPGVLEW